MIKLDLWDIINAKNTKAMGDIRDSLETPENDVADDPAKKQDEGKDTPSDTPERRD
jgi:hypothetical protein